jgi:hypothetical protein
MKTRYTNCLRAHIDAIPQGRDAALRRPDGAARRPYQKLRCALCLLAALLGGRALAQDSSPRRPAPAGDYATDLATVGESQQEALEQAKQMLEDSENPTARAALKTAITEMEAAEKSLQTAKKNPDDLPAAVSAEQAAYQALLKLVPHEYRVSRSRRGSKGGGAGQPGQRQMEQIEMTSDENRYETERQAAAAPTGQQREQLEAADRLKQLAQRQQDLNDRLRELQTALQQARTEKEQEEIKRELKHLADEERQMLSDVDELRQKLDQSPNSSLSQTARDLDQTRAETQRAAQELANQSVSQALASGTRAQQSMQNLRENLRSQTSSQFSTQMRQLQNQARDLAQKEEEIGRGMEELDNADHKTLDNSQQRQQLVQQMAKQESSLTNLLANMQDVTEKAESTEPLLAEQLYDTLRRSGQMHTESLLEAGGELVDRGFLNKAAEVERSARTNINELRQRVEKAAESVLGSQAEALRYAQTELNDLTKQVERDVGGAATNSAASSGAGTNSPTPREQAKGNGQQGNGNGQQAKGNGKGQQAKGNGQQANGDGQQANGDGGADRLRELVQQIGGAQDGARGGARGGANGGTGLAGPILGDNFANWADRMRDVEQVVDSVELRNRLATVRERVAAYRADYRLHDRRPLADAVKKQVLQPMTDVRVQLLEALARLENARSLVPLDHDPVPDNYSELVRRYYEKLGGGQ